MDVAMDSMAHCVCIESIVKTRDKASIDELVQGQKDWLHYHGQTNVQIEKVHIAINKRHLFIIS